MTYEFKHDTNYNGDEATTEIGFYKEAYGLTIESDISTPRLSGHGVYVHQHVIAVLPDSEAIKLRDALIEMYPIKEQKQ